MIDAVPRSLGSVRRGRGAGVAKRNQEGAQTAAWPPLAGKRPAEQGPPSCLEAVRGDEDGVQAVVETSRTVVEKIVVTQPYTHQHTNVNVGRNLSCRIVYTAPDPSMSDTIDVGPSHSLWGRV